MAVCRREIERAMKPLLKYAYVLSRDPDVACDLVQETILKALSTHHQPARAAAFRPWLFSILRNTFIDHLRARHSSRAFNVPLEEADQNGIADAGAFRDAKDGLINSISVRRAMDLLSDPHREVVALIDIVGFSYEEAAQLLDVPKGTIMSRLNRARHSLLDIIGNDNIHALDHIRETRRARRSR